MHRFNSAVWTDFDVRYHPSNITVRGVRSVGLGKNKAPSSTMRFDLSFDIIELGVALHTAENGGELGCCHGRARLQ